MVRGVEFLDGLVNVRRGWDAMEGEITPKSRTGVRKVPMPTVLSGHLEARYKRAGGAGLVFGQGQAVRPSESRKPRESRVEGPGSRRADTPRVQAHLRSTPPARAQSRVRNRRGFSTIIWSMSGCVAPAASSSGTTVLVISR